MFDLDANDYGDGIICVFGFLLNSEQQNDLLELQKLLAQKAELKYRFSEQNPPYVRLYECVLPAENYPTVLERVKEVVAQTTVIPMHWGEIEESVHSVILWGERNETLLDFQQEVVRAIQPFREGYFKQKYKEMEYLTPLEKKSVEEWGWPWVENYEPYVVIAKPENEFPVGKINLEWGHTKAKLDHVLIAEKRNHQLSEINIYPLSQQ